MSFFNTLPTGLRGSVGQNSTCLGDLVLPKRALHSPMISSALADAPALSSTIAVTRSPQSGSGVPTTAQSCTAGCDQISCSISLG